MRISDWSSDVCSSDLLPGNDSRCPTGRGGLHARALAVPSRLRPREPDQPGPRRHPAHHHEFPRAVRRHRDRLPGLGRPGGFRSVAQRSEEHTSELQSLMRISYAVFCLKKKKHSYRNNKTQSPKNPTKSITPTTTNYK